MMERVQTKARGSWILWGLLLSIADGLPLSPGVAQAGKPEVIGATATCTKERVCSLAVTVRHADEGWEHYANRWEVRTPDGQVIGTRVLSHPHEDEQPFTRSLDEISVPEGVSELHVYANDSVHGLSESPLVVRLK